jgi:hypothetical protein
MLIGTASLENKPARPIRYIVFEANLELIPEQMLDSYVTWHVYRDTDHKLTTHLLNVGNSLRLYPFPDICL